MPLPTTEIPRSHKPIPGDALAIPTVVTPVDLTGGANVPRRTAARFNAALTLQAGAPIKTVAFTASCSDRETHTTLYKSF